MTEYHPSSFSFLLSFLLIILFGQSSMSMNSCIKLHSWDVSSSMIFIPLNIKHVNLMVFPLYFFIFLSISPLPDINQHTQYIKHKKENVVYFVFFYKIKIYENIWKLCSHANVKCCHKSSRVSRLRLVIVYILSYFTVNNKSFAHRNVTFATL